MKLMLLAAIFIPLLVGDHYHLWGLGFGGNVIGLIMFTCLIVLLPGVFRARNYRDSKL
jgi:hypothetical protein